MYKYIWSIIFVNSLLTGVSIIPEITNNLTDLDQLQFEQQKPLQLIAKEPEEEVEEENDPEITAGDKRDNRSK